MFLCKTPFDTALSNNWYAFDNAEFKASLSSAFASSNTFLTAVLIDVLKATFLTLFLSAINTLFLAD